MAWYEYALWGFLGGVVIDGIELWRAIRANKGKLPKSWQTFSSLFGEFLRLTVGSILAVGFGESGQVTTPLAAMTIGIAAPAIIERLSKNPPKADS